MYLDTLSLEQYSELALDDLGIIILTAPPVNRLTPAIFAVAAIAVYTPNTIMTTVQAFDTVKAYIPGADTAGLYVQSFDTAGLYADSGSTSTIIITTTADTWST